MDLAKAYRVETDRCIIRCYEPADTLLLHEAILHSIEHLRPWLPWGPQEPKTLEARTALVRNFRGKFDLGMDYVFGIFDKTDTTLLGATGLHTRVGINAREIGYWISAEHINKGYATEAVSALTKVGFEIERLSRIEIHCVPENLRSRQIPYKLGYTLESITPDNKDSEHRDLMIWAIGKADYDKSPLRNTRLRAFDFRGQEIPL